MTDPVVDPEGNTYEREAIMDWLSKNSTSPITRTPLRASQLVPNRALRAAIEEEIKRSQENNEPISRSAPLKAESKDDNSVPTEAPGSAELMIYRGTPQYHEEKNKTEMDIRVSVVTPVGKQRGPIDICCVVDVSGSMGSDANIKGVENTVGLSLLDIVKHAILTIIGCLGTNDRLSVVSFSDSASIIFPLIPMTTEGKARAKLLVNGLNPGGRTNLWDGLLKGMDVLAKDMDQTVLRNSTVFLLTDGEPNIEPPRGLIPMMKKYREQHDGMYPGTVHTFGFGYSLNSRMLLDIAKESNGAYAFIPDSGFVGTIFVNALANQQCAFGSNAVLEICPDNGAK